MINTLNLDDRVYDEIREDAIKNIVKHCPSWTNHNASDPGIALVELFSSMTEMLLYRFNRVPDKNYMAFLDMLGINANFVSPAVSRVQFNLVENFEQHQDKKSTKHVIPQTQFITKDKEVEERPLMFETVEDLYISNLKLKKILSKSYNEQKEKYQVNLHQSDISFTPFQDNDNIEESIIYLADEKFKTLALENVVTVIFSIDIKQSKQLTDSWFKEMKWEYFNGEIWKKLKTMETSLQIKEKYKASSNAEHFFVTFQGDHLDFQNSIKKELSEDKAYYIRGRIDVEAHQWLKDEEIQIYEIHKEVATSSEGVKPNKILYNNAPLDLNNRFYPLGEEPKEHDIFLLEDEAFSKIGQELTLRFQREGSSNQLLRVDWEYPISKNEWHTLNTELNNIDNLQTSGTIQFKVPQNLHKTIVNGEPCYAIRARVTKEDYTQERQKKEDTYYQALRNQDTNGSTPIKENLNLPYYNSIKISYREPKQIIENCYVYNNGNFIRKIEFNNEHRDNVKKSFLSEKLENDTSLYFGFDAYLQNDYLDLFFEIEKRALTKEIIPIKWEIYANNSWKILKVIKDESNHLSRSGDIRFKIEQDTKNEHLFELAGMWIRANFSKEKSTFSFPYTINSILQNSTIVYQQETLRNEFIGISIGIPNMKFKLNHKNIVYPPTLLVEDVEYKPIKRKKRFIDHSSEEKVYRFNSLNGEIVFGDNQYASIPNPKEDIYATQYAISYGENGNIGKEELKLRTTIQSMGSATNVTPATGGSNAEDLEDLIHRAPEMLRVKNRVVTAKDYESASVDFSPYILKAKAISKKDSDIDIFVVTKDILENKSMKEEILLQELEERLKQMSLVTVIPKVILPQIVEINIKVELVSTMDTKRVDDKFKSKLERKARDYFDVTQNFPMGKLVISEADLYKILHQDSFGYYYKNIKIWKDTEHEPSQSNQLEINRDDKIIKLNIFEIED